jgi:hypothetical protein
MDTHLEAQTKKRLLHLDQHFVLLSLHKNIINYNQPCNINMDRKNNYKHFKEGLVGKEIIFFGEGDLFNHYQVSNFQNIHIIQSTHNFL